MFPKKYIVITGAWFMNKGSEAMAFTVVNEMKLRFPKHRIVVISYSVLSEAEKKHYAFEILPERFSTGETDDPFDAILGTQNDAITKQVHAILRQTAFALDISGFMLSSQWGELPSLVFLRRIYAARYFGYDVYLLSQSFGPFEYADAKQGKMIGDLMHDLLKYPKVILAREQDGFERLQKYCSDNLKRKDDIVLWHKEFDYKNLWLNDFKPRTFAVNENSVALIPNVRVNTHGVGNENSLELYLRITRKLLSLKYNVYLITHSEEDFEICTAITEQISNEKLYFIEESLNCIEFELLIKQFNFAIVSRFHAAVHSYRENVPCVIIGWAEKYLALADLFAQSNYVIDVRNNDYNKLTAIAVDAMSHSYVREQMQIVNAKKNRGNNIFSELFGVSIPSDCTGCGACASTCSAISISENENGFRKAAIDTEKCILCGKCENVCHLRQIVLKKNTYEQFFAAKCKDINTLFSVSSGGVSYALCKSIVNGGGIAYGAVQTDPLSVEHRRADSLDECERFKGSKYLQSSLYGIYEKVKEDLSAGNNVIFTGVGCQIAGLYSFLGSDFSNLVTCEVVCHGVPSSMVFQNFIKELEAEYKSKVTNINFRDKSAGWSNNQIAITFENGTVIKELSIHSPFHRGYLNGLYYDKNCHKCATARLPRIADVTLADYWQYQGELKKDDVGVSLVVCNTKKGCNAFGRISSALAVEPTSKEQAVRSCRHLTKPPRDSLYRDMFFDLISKIGFSDSLFACENYDLFKVIAENKRLPVFAKLVSLHIPCYYIVRPNLMDGWNYTEAEQRRMKSSLSFTKMANDKRTYKSELKLILKEKYSEEYINQLCAIPPVIRKGVKYVHADSNMSAVTVVNGERVTPNQPDVRQAIHIYGRCGVFGYAVEDADTMPAQLQQIINVNKANFKVINHGVWGADDDKLLNNLYVDIESGIIRPNDAVIVYMWALPEIESIKNLGIAVYDTTKDFHNQLGDHYFYDKPGHMTAEGYKIIAGLVYAFLQHANLAGRQCDDRVLRLARIVDKLRKYEKNDTFDLMLNQFIQDTKKSIRSKAQNYGAVVMNCNPFTLGHRYLIETAAKEVPHLIVFVVQEDKSVYRFSERFELVKKGTRDIKNVTVVPGGEFIISTLTFPEYFIKDQVKQVAFSPSGDVEIFARHIAPALNISVRFAGTEPNDKVTANYNKCMREILPRYGIMFREMERIEMNGEVISASTVRKMAEKSMWDPLQKYLPECTLEFLKNRSAL